MFRKGPESLNIVYMSGLPVDDTFSSEEGGGSFPLMLEASD